MIRLLTRTTARWILAAGIVAAAAGPASAQPHDGAFELSLTYGRNSDAISFAEPFATGLRLGGLRDVRIDSRPETQQNFGIAVAGTFWTYLQLFTEFNYNHLGESHLSGRIPFFASRATFTARMQFYEWTSGARVQIPTGTWRARPFVGGGAGPVWAVVTGEAEGIPSESQSARDLMYHADFGVRVFLTSRVGVAPELRLVNIPDDTFYRALVSAVFRF